MRRGLWLIRVALLVAIGTVVGFEVGGRTGFHEGFRTACIINEEITGAHVITTLTWLGKGDIERARDLLDLTLDSSIAGIAGYSRFSPTPLESFVFSVEPDLERPSNEARFLNRFADYRRSHPYEDPSGKWAVDWLLARYGTPAQAEH